MTQGTRRGSRRRMNVHCPALSASIIRSALPTLWRTDRKQRMTLPNGEATLELRQPLQLGLPRLTGELVWFERASRLLCGLRRRFATLHPIDKEEPLVALIVYRMVLLHGGVRGEESRVPISDRLVRRNSS